jgi:hypothetical protein
VNALYRRDRDTELLNRCDGLGLEPRAPHKLFAGRLAARNEAALLLKHAAFRDRVQGRERVAATQRELADEVYNGRIDHKALRESALYPTLREILAGEQGQAS